jgi:phosphatidylglycerophosphatase C
MPVITDSNIDAQREILAFDFDGTITTRDTFALFLRYYAGGPRWALNILRLLPTFAAYKLRRIDRHAVKHAVIKRFFAGEPVAQVEAKAERFARDVIPGLVRPAALAHLKGLLDGPDTRKETLYICSASIGPYLRHWAASLGIASNHVLATEMETHTGASGNSFTGKLLGYNVWGANKVRRISDTFAPHSVKILEAYGDTRGDREMLHAAQASFFRPFRV